MADFCPRCGAKLKVRILPYLDNARIEECDNCGWPAASSATFASPSAATGNVRGGEHGHGMHVGVITATGFLGLIIGFVVYIAPVDPVAKFFILGTFTFASFFAGSGLTGLAVLLMTTQVFFSLPLGQYVLDKSGGTPY